jgi:hypothetical protein
VSREVVCVPHGVLRRVTHQCAKYIEREYKLRKGQSWSKEGVEITNKVKGKPGQPNNWPD